MSTDTPVFGHLQTEKTRAGEQTEVRQQKTGTSEVDATSQLWLAAAKAAESTRAAEGHVTRHSKVTIL